MPINTSTIGDIDTSEVETANGSLNTSEIGEVIDHTNSELQFIGVIGIDGITNTPARIVYNATQDRYQLRKNATEKSEVGVSAVTFYEPRVNGIERITLTVPESVEGSYTLTLPGTLPTVGSTLLVDTEGTFSWQTAITASSVLGGDNRYHVICSDPTTNQLIEADDLVTDQVLVGNNAALPTPRTFSPNAPYGTDWEIDTTTVKSKLADVPLTVLKEELGDAYHVLQRDEAGEVISNSVKAIALPSGGTSARPTPPVPGMIRYNTDLGNFEQYTSVWGPIGVSSSTGLLLVDTVATFEASTTLLVGQVVYVLQNDTFYEIYTSSATRDGTFVLDAGTAGVQGKAVAGKYIYGDFKVSGTMSVDTINENTSAAGVSIETVLVKDGTMGLPNSEFKTTVQANTLSGNNTVTLPTETAVLATRSDKLSAFAATTSAEIAGVISDETGYASGAKAVFSDSPTFINTIKTPTIEPVTANTVLDVNTNAAINLPIGTTAQRPGTPAQGDFRFNSDEQKLEVYTSSGWTAAGAGGTVIKVAQSGIGTGTFVGQSLYLAVSTWTLASHTADNTAEVVGLISKITDSGNIEVTLGGEVSPIAYASVFETTPADGDVVWLGTTTGLLTTTKPTTVGYVAKPLGGVRYTDAASVGGSGYCSVLFNNQRGDVIGGTNLYSTIGLANNATTSFHTIQGVAGTGGWLSGTIVINATTDYVIPFFCHFSRQLDGTTYNVAAQFGSTIPSGLSITNSGSSVQVVMPNFTGGETFVSASVTYCVQAAASGTTLPVSVSARSVLADTSGTAIPSGVLGYNAATTATVSGAITANTNTVITSHTLNKGVYLLFGSAYLRPVSTALSEVQITTGTTINGSAGSAGYGRLQAGIEGDVVQCASIVLTIAADATAVNLVGKAGQNSTAGGFSGTLGYVRIG